MKEKTRKGHPIIFSIMIAVLMVVLISVATAVATILEYDDRGIMIAQSCAFVVMALIVTLYMKNRKISFENFGFKRFESHLEQKALYYIPLLIIALVQPIMGGFNLKLSWMDIIIIVLFSLFVGYTEETIFRGIIMERLKSKGPAFYIIFSSILFGLLHMANALSGDDMAYIILQVINALLLGFILALLIVATKNIIPLIAFHFLFDALAQMTNANIVDKEIQVVILLNTLYLFYGLFLIYVLKRTRRINNHLDQQLNR